MRWSSVKMSLLCGIIDRCGRNEASKRIFVNVSGSETFNDLVQTLHGPGGMNLTLSASSKEDGPWVDIPDFQTSVMSAVNIFNIRFIHLKCKCERNLTDSATVPRTAFDILMANEKRLPSRKVTSPGMPKEKLTDKDRLFNQLLDLEKQEGCSFSKSDADSEGGYITQIPNVVLCNALWYVTNHHDTIKSASLKRSEIIPVPPIFEKFQGFDDTKRKKLKKKPLSSNSLKSHSEALYSISLRPSVSTPMWALMNTAIKNLARCFQSYALYLDLQLEQQTKRQKLEHPVREVFENITVEHRTAVAYTLDQRYELINQAVNDAGLDEVVVFDESKHLLSPFQSSMQRLRYLENLQLTVPVDMFKYAPGGSHTTVIVFVQADPKRTNTETLTKTARVMSQIKPLLPVFHTRQMKINFQQKFQNVAFLSPSVLEFLYKELSLDASVASHPDTQQRLRLIFLGEKGLLPDLRKLNAGRPSVVFDTFWENLGKIIEQVTAADERRHNVAHLSQWISLKDLIQQAKALCPNDTPIPSSALVRLQFTPRNPYVHTALNFTGRFGVQYKIQRRQLRAQHPDDHYCAALLKYMKCLAVALGTMCVFFSCDDKAKIPLGEPGLPLSTGVRGKKTLAPVNTTLSALDHDVNHKGSLTPSVYLKVDLPDEVTKSFCRGQACVTLNDAVFQSSGPFRHAVALEQQLDLESTPKILLKFSDGGTDQRNNLESVKCSLIYLFKKLDLDMLVAARCAPGQSWTNMAERIMSILNLGLQNCSLMRETSSPEMEAKLAKCGNMSDIREMEKKVPGLKEAWTEATRSCRETIEGRFERLSIKDKPIKMQQPVEDASIQEAKTYMESLFSGLDASNITKKTTKKVEPYQKWLEEHCRSRRYSFQIRKCLEESCCSPAQNSIERLKWLPDPVLDQSGQHFKPFESLYGTETSEEDRPSLLEQAAKQTQQKKRQGTGATKSTPQKVSKVRANLLTVLCTESSIPSGNSVESAILTAQNAQATFECVDCKKPRVVYSKNKLTERQQTQLITAMTEYEYSCGAPVTPPTHPLHGKVFMKLGITCDSLVENPYYSSDIGQKDLCCFCGTDRGHVDTELKKRYKTVLPVCATCTAEGHEPVCFRPYGNKN